MEKTITLNVRNIVDSPFCVSTDDGMTVFHAIRSALDNQQKIVISFAGVESLTSAFLNAAIGQLYGDYDAEYLKAALQVQDMARTDMLLLKRVVETAKRYFADPEGISAARDRVLETT